MISIIDAGINCSDCYTYCRCSRPFLGTLFSGALSAFCNVPFLLNEAVKLFGLLSNDRLNDGVSKDSSLDLAVARTRRTDVFAFDARVRPRSSEFLRVPQSSSEFSYQNMNSNVFDHTAPSLISIYPKIQSLLRLPNNTYLML